LFYENKGDFMNGMIESRMKGRIKITFMDRFGIEEAGIDGGGMFKEFITE
jgi:ubiquitin-protein ligase E3 C